VQRAQRFRQPLSLIAMDMDDFKPINDRMVTPVAMRRWSR
jgi:GGDEF domain-containing protein